MKLVEENKAKELFEKFCQGYKRRDLPFLLSLFTKKANGWGTGVDEYMNGPKEIEGQLKKDWSQSDKGEIQIVSFVPAADNANWAAATCRAIITIQGEEHTFEDFRGTIVAEKEEGEWKIAHMHASFPDYRNSEGGSFPVGE
jgi:hypothetical protein